MERPFIGTMLYIVAWLVLLSGVAIAGYGLFEGSERPLIGGTSVDWVLVWIGAGQAVGSFVWFGFATGIDLLAEIRDLLHKGEDRAKEADYQKRKAERASRAST